MVEDHDFKEWIEVAGLTDYITQYGSGSSLYDLKLSDLYKYLQNPYSNISQIQKSSKYLTNKHGIIKEVLRTFKSLPSLDYIISWSDVDDEKKIKKYERRVNDFLKQIDIRTFVRDGLFEVGEMGTVVSCFRNKKYIQFLDLDDLRINKQRNGRWIVEYDLSSINKLKTVNDKLTVIESLPEEITLEKYNLYKKKGKEYQYIELKNADVINIDANRNVPYGLPLTLGAWSSLLQKEIIDRVERSVADRLLKTIVILSAGHLDKNGDKPVPKEIITAYFKEVSKLFQKKNGGSISNQDDSSGTGTIALPHFFKLDTLEVNTELFKKELYEKIENDIYANLGLSPAVIWGGGSSGNYSAATLNGQKFYQYIYTVLEKFEIIINRYINQILPNNVSCQFIFTRTTIFDKDKHVDKYKELYLQTGISKFWLESLTGLPYENVIGQAEYERKILKTEQFMYPPSNAYTQSGNTNGRPPEDNPTNESTIKSKSSNSNNNPKPSTT